MSRARRVGRAVYPKRDVGPQPPRRDWFIRVGDVWESDGVLWVMKRHGDEHGTWKVWERYEGELEAQK